MQQVEGNQIVLVLGGVRSGKSRYAEQLAAQSQRVIFVATAEPRGDEEMRQKIARHRSQRPSGWTTIEERLELASTVRRHACDCDAMLIDCLTLFSANLLDDHGADSAAIDARVNDLCSALQSACCRVILVSNEVGSGVVPAYASGRRFRDLLGELNQRVASVADTVFFMVAGLPLPLKGSPSLDPATVGRSR